MTKLYLYLVSFFSFKSERDFLKILGNKERGNSTFLISVITAHLHFVIVQAKKLTLTKMGNFPITIQECISACHLKIIKSIYLARFLFFQPKWRRYRRSKNSDFGDIKIGLRFHLKQLGDHYLMASVATFIPAYDNNQLPYAGFDRFGLEGRLILAGNSPQEGKSNNFHKLELSYRYFFPSDPGQIRVFASQGVYFFKKAVILGELDGIFSFSNDSDFFENNLQMVSDFRMVKASINLGYEFTPKFSLYSGVFHDILNRNSGIGSGFQVFTVIRIASKWS